METFFLNSGLCMSLPTALCLSWCGTRRGERHRNTGPYSPQAHKDQFGERRIAFGGQRSIQLSYGCVGFI
jgi:hypothetical protein